MIELKKINRRWQPHQGFTFFSSEKKAKSLLKFPSRGFTLIELLVVMAILGILVVVVIVAINPVGRLRDTRNRRAEYDVRGAATAVSTCLTKEQESTSEDVVYSDDSSHGCANPDIVDNYGTFAAGVTLTFYNDTGAKEYKICAHDTGYNGAITSWNTKDGGLKLAGTGSTTECDTY